jgi:methyltransferase-like protein/SAM-dependent methyltransferase
MQSSTDADNPYDQMPYLSTAFRSTNPEGLATLARLVGIESPAVTHCRVLELGCSNGGNLIPMAYAWPGSEFVGIDLSARQIQMGHEAMARLSLANIQLHALNLLEVGEQFGHFDYIIAHGIYSWVPPDVQDKILELCNQLLTPRGIAYVSYNTYPGWHFRAITREMMIYHVRNIEEPEARVRAARSLLGFLAEQVGQADVANLTATDAAAYSAALRYEHHLIGQFQDSYVFHEHLESINEPLYFTEFVRRANQHGLQYVTEADFVSAQLVNFPPAVGEKIRSLATDVIETQQYMDFVSNRTFRQTVLCRQSLTLNRTATTEMMHNFHAAAFFKAMADAPDWTSTKDESFTSYTNRTLTIGAPIVKAALMHLSLKWPEYIGFEALAAAAREILEPHGPRVYTAERVAEETKVLGRALLQCFAQGAAELHIAPAPFVTQIDSRPKASVVARWQAESGKSVTNMRHEMVQLDEISRHIIGHLDGHNDQAQLFNVLGGLAHNGTLVVQGPDGQPVEGEEALNIQLAEALQLALRRLAGSALLVA